MRFRSPELLERSLRENYSQRDIYYYFFTDDNFARQSMLARHISPVDKAAAGKHPNTFHDPGDTQAHKIPDFVDLAARAGCTQVFIGMESINPQNLKAAGKAQNNVQDYRNLIAAWHSAKIATMCVHFRLSLSTLLNQFRKTLEGSKMR